MRKLLVILALNLFLIIPSQADDISDLQIEGMSVGDSLLDYLTEVEIKNKPKYIYDNKKYIAIVISSPSFEIYDEVQIVYKSKDKKIHNIEAFINYKKNIKDCYSKKNEIALELTEFFKNKVENIWRQKNRKYNGDKYGESKFDAVNFDFHGGGSVRVICYDMGEKISAEKNWPDALAVTINSIEFDKYISTF